MGLGKINLITPPDRLFNLNLSYLVVKPSTKVKMQFQQILSQLDDDVNVYIFDQDETNIEWLLSSSQQSDVVIIDIDNCDLTTKNFVSVLLTQQNSFYLTNDETTPWNLLSRNRIYNLDWIVEKIEQEFNDEEDDEDDAE